MLVLFDIDLTLIKTSGAGMAAMGDAGRELFGPDFDETRTDFAGRLDPLIIRDLLRDNGIEPTPARCRDMRAGYARHLPRRLESHGAQPLPGAIDLVNQLHAVPGLTLGLLTGNFEETGRLKLRAAGVDTSAFVCNVWGDESPHKEPAREDLPPIAIERYRARHNTDLSGQGVTIIGDTVHDVSCALANGCRVLAVATGYTSAAELQRAGAHRVVGDLSDVEAIKAWLLDVE